MYQEIINFWFSEIAQSQWWVKDDKFDQIIVSRFLDIHKQAAGCELYGWRQTCLGRLAEIIVLDQFSRNIYRDIPAAFACDAQALVLAQEAVSNGIDTQLNVEQRGFLYMPFMHSESPHIHIIAENLFVKLGVESNIVFERKHKAIIDKFGRYPHRNDILGRISTKEEEAFLKLPGSSF